MNTTRIGGDANVTGSLTIVNRGKKNKKIKQNHFFKCKISFIVILNFLK